MNQDVMLIHHFKLVFKNLFKIVNIEYWLWQNYWRTRWHWIWIYHKFPQNSDDASNPKYFCEILIDGRKTVYTD